MGAEGIKNGAIRFTKAIAHYRSIPVPHYTGLSKMVFIKQWDSENEATISAYITFVVPACRPVPSTYHLQA